MTRKDSKVKSCSTLRTSHTTGHQPRKGSHSEVCEHTPQGRVGGWGLVESIVTQGPIQGSEPEVWSYPQPQSQVGVGGTCPPAPMRPASYMPSCTPCPPALRLLGFTCPPPPASYMPSCTSCAPPPPGFHMPSAPPPGFHMPSCTSCAPPPTCPPALHALRSASWVHMPSSARLLHALLHLMRPASCMSSCAPAFWVSCALLPAPSQVSYAHLWAAGVVYIESASGVCRVSGLGFIQRAVSSIPRRGGLGVRVEPRL